MNDRSDAESTALTVPLPTTSAELVTVMVHYHRAEVGRMAGWRDRIDRTSNWAITVVAAMLSVSLSTPTAHHGVLLFAMLLIYLLLWIEARRYRFFDVYRARVRQIERHYLAQLFCPMTDFSANWQQVLGQSLREPRFLLSYGQAFSRRLRRNYIWMFVILLIAWVLKISTPGLQEARASVELVELDPGSGRRRRPWPDPRRDHRHRHRSLLLLADLGFVPPGDGNRCERPRRGARLARAR